MRVESSITAISWIPSEAIRGPTRLPFDLGVGHYDDPPPDVIGDVGELHKAGAFRFANVLRAWIDVDDSGRIVAHENIGRGYISETLMRVGQTRFAFLPTSFPVLRPDPEVSDGEVRFVQTAGGRPGVPAPRRVRGRPFLQWLGPTVWTTLELTLRTDGTSDGTLVGASQFPRHWMYDHEGRLVAKSAVIDFKTWYHGAFGKHSPWGDEDSPAFVAMAETALERDLSVNIMRSDKKPGFRTLAVDEILVRQATPGRELYLLLDGVIEVSVDGETIGDLGPGAVVGERAFLEGGLRTATLRAVTPCRVAVADAADVDPAALSQLAEGHHRESR